jgi:hypothetical protein
MSQTPEQGAQDAGTSPGSSPEPRDDEWAPNPDDVTDPSAEAEGSPSAGADVDLPEPTVVEPTD